MKTYTRVNDPHLQLLVSLVIREFPGKEGREVPGDIINSDHGRVARFRPEAVLLKRNTDRRQGRLQPFLSHFWLHSQNADYMITIKFIQQNILYLKKNGSRRTSSLVSIRTENSNSNFLYKSSKMSSTMLSYSVVQF